MSSGRLRAGNEPFQKTYRDTSRIDQIALTTITIIIISIAIRIMSSIITSIITCILTGHILPVLRMSLTHYDVHVLMEKVQLVEW